MCGFFPLCSADRGFFDSEITNPARKIFLFYSINDLLKGSDYRCNDAAIQGTTVQLGSIIPAPFPALALGVFLERICLSCWSCAPCSVLQLQLHSGAMRLSLRLEQDSQSGAIQAHSFPENALVTDLIALSRKLHLHFNWRLRRRKRQ